MAPQWGRYWLAPLKCINGRGYNRCRPRCGMLLERNKSGCRILIVAGFFHHGYQSTHGNDGSNAGLFIFQYRTCTPIAVR